VFAITRTTTVVNRTVDTNVSAAETVGYLRRASRRIAEFVRPGKLSTVMVPAIKDDVDAARATSIGEWIAPTDLVWRPGIEFKSASGLLSINASLSTLPRRLVHSLESGELPNDLDDDGDGLVDEGTIALRENGVTLSLIRNVEKFSLSLEGRLLRMRLRIARKDGEGRVLRSFLEQTFYMRNN